MGERLPCNTYVTASCLSAAASALAIGVRWRLLLLHTLRPMSIEERLHLYYAANEGEEAVLPDMV